MSYPVGIDLGTTNSVICVWRRGAVESVPVEGRSIMPSAVSIRADGSALVGQAAKAKATIDPEHSVLSVKRSMGDGKACWDIYGRTYTPVDISAMILGRLKAEAERYLACAVTDAVITVPAYFKDPQRRDTKLAGEKAGLRVLELEAEPTAAAISYGLDKGKDQTLMVYDLGGGTFDVSILDVRGNRFRARAVDGDSRLGGDDFDLALADHLIGLLQKRTSRDLGGLRALFGGKRKMTEPTPRDMLVARQRLKEAAEKAKIELSQSDAARVTIPEILGASLDEEITLATYNRLIVPLVDRTIAKARDVLRAAGLKPSDIDRLILVGGSTWNRLVKERVTEAVKEPWTADRVDEVVGQGAAIVASYRSAPGEDNAPAEEDRAPIESLSNVTPFNLGVRASSRGDRDLFRVIIPRNTPTDAGGVEQEFTTYAAGQKTVDIAVFQGEHSHCKENTFIGGFQLTGIPAAPAGQPKILVRFEIDGSGLLSVTARCSHLSSQKQLDVNMVNREDDLPRQAPEADIVFLVDTSGSMSTELDGVKASGLAFANRVIDGGLNCRLGLMDFDLPLTAAFSGGSYRWEVFGPMDPPRFPAAVSGLTIGRLGGCGCYVGNANTVPVMEAFVGAFPNGDRTKIGILISDEVGNDGPSTRRIIDILRGANVTLHVLGVSGSCHEDIARETGGRFWAITASRGHVDFSELLDTIAVEITNLALRGT